MSDFYSVWVYADQESGQAVEHAGSFRTFDEARGVLGDRKGSIWKGRDESNTGECVYSTD